MTAGSPVPILLVDDNAAKRLALKAVLAPLGHAIVEADCGVAALRRVMVQDFAVILLDVCMPVMDGFETAALIRERRQSEMTPIIFITAYASDEIVPSDRYVEGAVDFISAPVSPHELRAKVSVFANLFRKAELLATQAREVQTSADQLRLLTEAAPIGIFQTDTLNRYVYTNPRWTEITGISSEQASGRDWASIVGSEQQVDPRAGSADGTASPAELSQRFEVRLPGATARIVLVTSKSISGPGGEMTGWVGTLADITAETGAELAMSGARDKATEASRLKSDFLANMSHEIRTPMNGVLGMTGLLLETDLDACQRDYAQTVLDSGEALLTIINDILDFSKVEAGKLEIERVEFDIRSIVDDVVDLLMGSAKAKGLPFAAVVESSVPAVVTGDPGRVRQVLTNLIGNAIKFTQTGEIAVRVSEGQAQTGSRSVAVEDQTVVRFEISDTGDGIAADKLAVILQPFTQADTSTTRKYGGTGLGLAISTQLVTLMEGDLGVTSELGTGSTFWFTVPVRTDAGQPSSRSPAQETRRCDVVAVPPRPPSSVDGLARGRLLLAEDNLINQKVAVAMLSGAGYLVETVPTGAAALQAVTDRHYDAILMDCQMPELNGYEATAAIRAHEGQDRHTPIIALTAGARQEDRERCLAAGMDGYLAKPMSKDALLAVVARSIQTGAGHGVGHEPAVARTI